MQPQRAVVNQLKQSLSCTNTPLTTAQANQMGPVIARTAPATDAVMVGGGGGPRWIVRRGKVVGGERRRHATGQRPK